MQVCQGKKTVSTPPKKPIKHTNSPLVQGDLLRSVLSLLGLPVALEAPENNAMKIQLNLISLFAKSKQKTSVCLLCELKELASYGLLF